MHQEAQATLVGGFLRWLLMLHWYLLYQPAYAGTPKTVRSHLATAGLVVAVLVVWATMVWTRGWPAITRGMLGFANGAVVLGLGSLGPIHATPWAQESGNASGDITFWPAFIVLGIPCGGLCGAVSHGSRGRRATCASQVTAAGVLPAGISLKQWEDEAKQWADHPVEFLSNKALLAHPMVLGMVFGQLCDGFATMVGIDMFGYGEKHPVSNAVIQYGGTINDALGLDWGEGAWLFALVKAALVGLIVWLFVQMRIEHRQQHFRLLIVLAVLIVGLAPGLRDIGRLMLGV